MGLEKAKEPFKKRAREQMQQMLVSIIWQIMMLLPTLIGVIYFALNIENGLISFAFISLAILSILLIFNIIDRIRLYKFHKGFLND